MTKTPDEIKKGLECCAASYADCHRECPFKQDCDGSQILKDALALALIQQLEAEKIGLLESSHEIRKDMIARINQLEAERDAMMHWAKGRCDTCAHKDDCVKHDPDPEGYVMHWYDDCEIWEWRGVQKEE